MKRSTGRSDEQGGGGAAGAAGAAKLGYAIVVVGTSWGGLHAVRSILGALVPEFDIPMVLVQHRHRDSDALLARFLQGHTQLRVCEVEDKQPIESGAVFVAPANYHVLVEHGHFSLSTEAPLRYSRPSIDIAMSSAAHAYGHQSVGLILTGANADGSAGLREIASSGGMAVIQDPGSAEVATMPRAALEAVPTARVFPLDRIGSFLGTLPSLHLRPTKSA